MDIAWDRDGIGIGMGWIYPWLRMGWDWQGTGGYDYVVADQLTEDVHDMMAHLRDGPPGVEVC